MSTATRLNVKNQIKFYTLCVLLGAVTGGLIWLFLWTLSQGLYYIWEWAPQTLNIPFYTLIVCTVGGLLIGLLRRKVGDLPEDLDSVQAKIKRDGRYGYTNIPIMALCAILPLLIGASIGPEAGMTGIIIGLCYWVGDNIKYAKSHVKELTNLGTSVTLGVIFHSPLFGLFEVNENSVDENLTLPKSSKIITYGICIAAGMGIYYLLTHFFGGGLGIHALDLSQITAFDYAMILPYALAGCILGFFYNLSHKITHKLSRIPMGLRETLGGLSLGIAGTLLPILMFSGESAMAHMDELTGAYLPIALVGIALLKILITNICIGSGLKGGHFFPLIFAGVCAGYGIAALVSTGGDHAVFAAAITTSAMMGLTMKKPIAVAMLLLLIFPVQLLIWNFVAAAIGAKLGTIGKKNRQVQDEANQTI